jgi:hypothetical protein
MQKVMLSIPSRAIRRCLLVLAVATALAATQFVQPIAAGSSGITLASGSFTLHGPQFGLPNGINRTFSFTVQQLPDGTIRGQAQVHTFAGNLVHVDVNCFALEGNQAIIGGTTTFDSQVPELVGSGAAFAIQDNPDVSTFFFGPRRDMRKPGGGARGARSCHVPGRLRRADHGREHHDPPGELSNRQRKRDPCPRTPFIPVSTRRDSDATTRGGGKHPPPPRALR